MFVALLGYVKALIVSLLFVVTVAHAGEVINYGPTDEAQFAERVRLARGAGVSIGMNARQCLLAWELPEHINETITSNGKHQQWVHGTHKYLYFDNGILTAIQE